MQDLAEISSKYKFNNNNMRNIIIANSTALVLYLFQADKINILTGHDINFARDLLNQICPILFVFVFFLFIIIERIDFMALER